MILAGREGLKNLTSDTLCIFFNNFCRPKDFLQKFLSWRDLFRDTLQDPLCLLKFPSWALPPPSLPPNFLIISDLPPIDGITFFPVFQNSGAFMVWLLTHPVYSLLTIVRQNIFTKIFVSERSFLGYITRPTLPFEIYKSPLPTPPPSRRNSFNQKWSV